MLWCLWTLHLAQPKLSPVASQTRLPLSGLEKLRPCMDTFVEYTVIRGYISKVMTEKKKKKVMTGQKNMTSNGSSISPITHRQQDWQKGKMEE